MVRDRLLFLILGYFAHYPLTAQKIKIKKKRKKIAARRYHHFTQV